jgi:hypothetical protein
MRSNRSPTRHQLVLPLKQPAPAAEGITNLPELTEALADLLLEALGGGKNESRGTQGACDEHEDHA